MELLLVFLDLWEIVDEVGEAPSLDASMKEQKHFKRCEKKDFGIIYTNLDWTNFVEIISCKKAIDS